MPTWDSTFDTSPPETQDHGRGGERIRESRKEVRLRFQTEHNVGDASTSGSTGYSDDGRHNPGSARVFVDGNEPSTLRNFDNTAVANGPTGLTTGLGADDKGRLWVDQSGGPQVFRWYDTGPSPNEWRAVNGYSNALMNPGFQVWQRDSTGPISCVVATDTFTADRWFVNPSGVGPYTVQRADAVFTSPNYGQYVMRINGGAGLTQVELGTRIEAADVARLRAGDSSLNISFRLLNTTGTTVTPTVRVSTANAENDFAGGVATPTTTGLTPATRATGAQGYHSTSFNTSAYANNNGLEISITFVGAAAMAAGSLDIGELILEWGKDRSIYVEPAFSDELRRCQRYYEKTFDYSVTPADNVGAAGALTGHRTGNNNAGRAVMMNWQFKAEKARQDYTLVYFNPIAGTAAAFQNLTDTGATDFAVLPTHIAVPGALDTRGRGRVTITNNTNATGGTHDDDILGVHVTCDAELI